MTKFKSCAYLPSIVSLTFLVAGPHAKLVLDYRLETPNPSSHVQVKVFFEP